MTETTFTLIDDGQPVAVPARLAEGAVWLAPGTAGLAARAGSPEPLTDLAARLERPLALDVEERAAYLGVSARDRATRLATREAPDFTLPDLTGRLHSLVEHRGKKVFLVAYASW
jgi:hypothetical protein